MEEVQHLICNRQSDVDPCETSYAGNCSICDAPIWIAYSSSEYLSMGAKPICFPCAAERCKGKYDQVMFMPPEGESLDSIMEHTGMSKEQVMEFMKELTVDNIQEMFNRKFKK